MAEPRRCQDSLPSVSDRYPRLRGFRVKITEAVLAPVSVAKAFESVLGPLMNRILENLNESRSLTTQRDVLLPRLVSGEFQFDFGCCNRGE